MPKPLRLSEVYLVRAEAYYWLNDDENSQKDLSSVMRKRISGFGSLGVSGDDLLKEIKNERARELYLEGFRLSDLKLTSYHNNSRYRSRQQKIQKFLHIHLICYMF